MSDIKHRNTSGSVHNKWSKYILIFFAALLLILIIWCVGVVIGALATVKNITVQGESPYSYEHIVAVSDIEPGMKMKQIDSRATENAILDNLPCISDVSVKKKAGGEVIIDITPEKVVYVASISGERYVMSDEFRVLCLQGEVVLEHSLLEIAFPEIKRAIVGQKIEFYDDSEYIDDFLEVIGGSELAAGTAFIDCSDKYGLKLLYENKYTVCFGDLENISLKLQKVHMIMQDSALGGENKAIIDVSDVAHPTVKLLS